MVCRRTTYFPVGRAKLAGDPILLKKMTSRRIVIHVYTQNFGFVPCRIRNSGKQLCFSLIISIHRMLKMKTSTMNTSASSLQPAFYISQSYK